MTVFTPAGRTVGWAFPAVLLNAIVLGSCDSRGTRLTIENKGRVPLDSVTVHLTGNQYVLGRISPGEARTQEINVTGESHIELSHTGKRRLVLDVNL